VEDREFGTDQGLTHVEQSPFSFHKKLITAFIECGDYFKELSEYKSKQMASGLSAEKGTMDLMGKPFTQFD
jgi:hypothetical protein